MRTSVLEHHFTISAPPEVVLSHLADPANYVGLNPYAVAVRDVRERDGATEYTAIEHTTMLGIGMDNPIDVVNRVDHSAGRQVMDVVGPGGVTVRIVTVVVAASSGSAVEDTFTLTGPALILAYARRLARAGQLHRAATLHDRLSVPS